MKSARKPSRKPKRKPHAVPKQRGRMGRETLLTPELQDEIVQILKEGHYQQVAVDCVGIYKGTYYGWLRQGKAAAIKQESGETLTESELSRLNFLNAIKKAKAEGIRHDINLITKAGKEGSWQALAWKRERMNPELFGRKDRVEVDSKVEQKVSFNTKQVEEIIQSLPEEELIRIVRDAKRSRKDRGHRDTSGLAH